MKLCAGADSGGNASQARTRLMNYPFAVWFPRAIQSASAKMTSAAAQLVAVMCLVACITGALAPG